MALVVDASVAVKWVVEEPASPAARRLLAESLMAPDLLVAECTNVLWRIARRGAIIEVQLQGALNFFAGVQIELVACRILMPRALDMARALDHAAYDCFYLALAEREATACVSADARFCSKVAGSEWAGMVKALET